ncbi:glutathione S-transferase [Penaeus vannamei]|uniref:Glutathione S-transferase n=1 Tax=Penaeus vannamei TaxID=6689 RepID=A0A3R7LYQ9_PENVA|nr:glutathione S-transferase [Penaeus vannamei]
MLLTAKAVGVELLKLLDLMAGSRMKPEFVAINPQHCVPTMVDGDSLSGVRRAGRVTLFPTCSYEVLQETVVRAICSYLATQYGKIAPLSFRPEDARLVDRLMYFDMGTLYFRFRRYVVNEGQPEKLENCTKPGWLDGYLDGHEWAVGNSVTVADFVLVATVSTFEAAGIDLSKHKNVTAWLARCNTWPLRGDETPRARGLLRQDGSGRGKLGKQLSVSESPSHAEVI